MASWSRFVKRIAAGGLLFGSLGFYANGQFRLTASYAVVSGPAVVVRAPVDGQLAHSLRSFAVSAAGARIATVRPAPANDPNLRAAKAELETVQAGVDSLKELVGLADELRSKTANRQSALASRRSEHLERMLKRADADLAAKKAAMDEAVLTKNRAVALCEEGLMGAQECDAAKSKAEIGLREFESADSQVGIARFLLGASQSGLDVGQDMGSEVTYARQQRDDLILRLASLKQQLATEEGRAKALQERVNPPAVEVTVAARSRTWSVFNQDGAQVVKGDPLFQVVDCDQLFVFAAVSEDRYERLRIDMNAEVKVDDRVYHGKIAQLLGPYGTFSQDRGMQPQPPVIVNGRDASNSGVAIAVPDLAKTLGPSCGIGTRAEVQFTQ